VLNLVQFPLSDAAKKYKGTTLFVNDGKSTYMALGFRNTREEKFPTASFKTIAGAGHWPHIESPAEFMTFVNDFLRE